jgi:pimeloyl-ACP methyl ester carboxylesterase
MSNHLRALLAFAITACASAPRPTYHAQPYLFERANGERIAAELGEVEVPEDRERPTSRRIKLRFVRFAATTPRPGSPIIYLAGGPGGSGIQSARAARFGVFMAMRAIADVIVLDQRGTGISEGKLDCAEQFFAPFDRPLSRAVLAEAIGRAARRCADQLTARGVGLDGYDTVQNAADLDDLRRALGAERMTLWGTSYGTTLALAVLQRNATHVDRVILAGAEPLDHMLKLPSDQQQLLETVSRLAAADPEVGKRVPDLLGAIARVIARLDASPATVAIADPASGEKLDIVVGPFDLQSAITELLRGPETLAQLPDLVARLEVGDWLALGLYAAGGRTGAVQSMMGIVTDCASGASQAWRDRIAREAAATLLGDAINAPMPEVCKHLPIKVLDDTFRTNPHTTVPVLAISGTLDGRTPPSNADRVIEHMPGARRLILDGAGHGDGLFVASPRITEIMLQFLRGELSADERITLPPLRFVPVRNVFALDAAARSRLAGEYRATDGAIWKLVDAGAMFWLIRPSQPLLPLRASSPGELFTEGFPTIARIGVDASGRATSLTLLPDGVTEGPSAVAVPSAPAR